MNINESLCYERRETKSGAGDIFVCTSTMFLKKLYFQFLFSNMGEFWFKSAVKFGKSKQIKTRQNSNTKKLKILFSNINEDFQFTNWDEFW